MGFVRATGNRSFFNGNRAVGDQEFRVKPGQLVPDDHWAVREHFEMRELCNDLGVPGFVPVDDDQRGTDMTEEQTRQALADAQERRQGILDDLAAVPDDTRSRGRQERRAALEEALDKVQTEIERHEKRLDLYRRVGGGGVGLESPEDGIAARAHAGHGNEADQTRSEHRGGLAAIERANNDGRLEARTSAELAQLIRRDPSGVTARWAEATADPSYASAFAKLLADPMNGHRRFTGRELEAFQRAEHMRAAINVGTQGEGGYLVPTHLDPNVILTNDGTINPLRQVSRTARISTTAWNGVTSAGVIAGYAAELSEVADADPDFEGPSIPVEKAHAFVGASIEATEDIAGLGETVARLFTDAKDRVEGEKFTVGTGTNHQPTGLVTKLLATTNSLVEVGTQGTFSVADVFSLSEALPARWRPRARYMGDLTVLNALEQFETANGSKQFPEVGSGRLLRRPLDENSDFPALAAATNNVDPLLGYGDFSQFLIVDRIGATIEFIPHLFGTTNGLPIGRRGWYLHWRSGSDVLVPSAFRLLVDPTSA